MLYRTIRIASRALPLALLAGCSGGDIDPSDDPTSAPAEEVSSEDAELTELAEVTTEDGSHFEFFETSDGEMIVHSASAEPLHELYADLQDGELTYVDLYEQISGQAAPDALVAAQARSDALVTAVEESDVDALEGLGRGEELLGDETHVGQIQQGISAQDYEQQFCDKGNWDYKYCWPATGGNPWVQRKGVHMHGFMAAVNDFTRFRFRYKKCAACSWKTSIDKQAAPGAVHHWQQTYFGYKRSRRWEILDNDGNPVRFSCHGLD